MSDLDTLLKELADLLPKKETPFVHNPDAEHDCLQPCTLLEACWESYQGHPEDFRQKRLVKFCSDMIKHTFGDNLEDRRDLCFGGLAPWEKRNEKTLPERKTGEDEKGVQHD